MQQSSALWRMQQLLRWLLAAEASGHGHSIFSQKMRRSLLGVVAVCHCQKPSGQAYLPPNTRRQQDCCLAEKAICHCREYSRQAYLIKREEKKIAELEADLQDAEMLFAGEKLSKREIADIAHKRELLSLAMQRKQAQEELNRDDGYHMPTAYDREGAAPSERYKVLTERYRCVYVSVYAYAYAYVYVRLHVYVQDLLCEDCRTVESIVACARTILCRNIMMV